MWSFSGREASPARRHLIVPPDILAVRRVSPVRVKTRTPWKPRESALTERGGEREWFADQTFVAARAAHLPTGIGTSTIIHTVLAGAALALALASSRTLPPVQSGTRLMMPAMVGLPPAIVELSVAPSSSPPSATSRPRPRHNPAATRPPIVPLQSPEGISEESGLEPVGGASEPAGLVSGNRDGLIGSGLPGGGDASLDIGAAPPPRASAPVRIGRGMQSPRKIRDARPVYPPEALAAQIRGVVIIEATIDVTGLVTEVRIVRSVPALDQAAVDAVRQWAYEPMLIDGEPVAVIITALVTFAIH